MLKKDYIIASGEQPTQEHEDPQKLLGLGLGISSVAAAGFIKTNNGRLWDSYLSAIRTAETAFPGAILRTFRVSETLSPFESWENLSVSEQQFSVAGKYAESLRNQFGRDVKDISMTRTGSIFGEVSSGGEVVGMGLRIKAGTQKGHAIADYYARVTGTDMPLAGVAGAQHTGSLNESLLRAQYRLEKPKKKFAAWVQELDPQERFNDLIIGAKFRDDITVFGHKILLDEKLKRLVARAEITVQLARARAATTVGRLNNLLSKPLEIPLIGEILNKIPLIRSMAVEPGTAMQMASRYAWKGMMVGAAWKGLEYYDYLRSEGGAASSLVGTAGGAAIGGFLFKRPGMRVSKTGLLVGAGAGLFTALSPRFDQGLFYGIASMFTDANIARAKASESIGLTESLQEQERVTPGLVSLPTALGFAGVGGLIGGFAQYSKLLTNSLSERISSGGSIGTIIEKTRESASAGFGEKLWTSSVGKRIASLPGGKFLSEHIKSPVVLGAAIGLGAWGLLSTGSSLLSGNIGAAVPGLNLIGSDESAEELQAMYSGQKEVAIRKGRWWEAGRSSGYEGGRIDYMRPHMMARLRDRAYQKGIYGSEEEKWQYDPMLHPIKALVGSDEWKYHYEIEHQYDRPAPLSSSYGEDIPFIGPAVTATFGKLLKPRKMIRPEEWNYGNGQYAYLPDVRGESEPAYDLGGLAPGAPVAPESGTQLLNELAYRRREAVGLVGFAEASIQKGITGREETFRNLQQMETMGEETSSEYWLWKHLNLGGAVGSSEGIRRFIPHERSYIDKYNPLANNLPSWIPSDYYTDLKHGNPFEKLPEAEIRLPGPGFAAIHPELQGVSPEQYPLAYKAKILGDIAMYSSEYEDMMRKAKANLRGMPEDQQKMVLETEAQVSAKKDSKRKIMEYRFRPELLTQQDVTVTNILDPRHIQTKEYGDAILELQGFGAVKDMEKAMEFAKSSLKGRVSIQVPTSESERYRLGQNYSAVKAVAMIGDTDYGRALAEQGLAQQAELQDEFEQIRFSEREKLAGSLTEKVMHSIESPLEMLTPISPAAKLIRQRSAIEEYIASEAVGTGNAFWDKPIENFIEPAFDTTMHKLGLGGIPEEVQKRREIIEYFDMLKWAKSKHAENIAAQVGDQQAVIAEKTKQQETMFGLDAYGAPMRVMKALPRKERDFFKYFSEAQTEEERSEILSLIPENEKRLYQAAWIRQAEQAAIAKKNAKIATLDDDKIIAQAQTMRASEGFEINEDLESQWQRETKGRVRFDDWIREKKAAEYFSTHSLPDPSWLGWCVPAYQDILMSDYKYSNVENIGLGDMVVTSQEKNSIEQIFKRQISEPILTLKVSHNSVHSMSATKNHLILGIRANKCKYNLEFGSICTQRATSWKCNFCTTKYHENYSACWMRMDEVTTDTYLPIPLLKHTNEPPVLDIGLLDCFPNNTLVCDDVVRPKTGRIRPMNRKILMDDATCWLIGYYLAEGNVWAVGDRMRGVQFTANIKEVSILELAQKIIKDRFGLDSVIRFKRTPDSESAYLVVASGIFGWLINYWVGRFCDHKFIPSWIEDITYSGQIALLDGLNTGDACKDERGRLILANKQLCEMAKRLYEAQGIPASLHGPIKRNKKDQYSIEPLSASHAVMTGENFMAYRVNSINESNYDGIVYDFEVDKQHMYCSPIGVYHNSPSLDIEDVKLKYVQMEGLSHYDFDLWDTRLRSLSRKPYINEDLIRQMDARANINEVLKTKANAQSLAKIYGNNARIRMSYIDAPIQESYDIEIQDSREDLVKKSYKELGVR